MKWRRRFGPRLIHPRSDADLPISGLIKDGRSGIDPRQNGGTTRRILFWGRRMKVRNSLKSLRGRHRDNQLVRRKGRVYIINKTQKRYKARQG